MPKKNQIKGLSARPLADGSTAWHWKPTPRERRAGWSNLPLGREYKSAVARAIARNEEVEAAARRGTGPQAAPNPVRTWRFADLVRAYKADPAFLDLKPKSQAEYASRLRTLETWAQDGELPIRLLDRAMVVELRNALVKDPRKHRTAALLRVLRLLLNFAAGQLLVEPGIAAAIDIPEAPSRRTVISPAGVDRLVAAATEAGDHGLALAIQLGFWSFQREGDLLALTRFAWRELTDMSGDARAALAGPDGKVMGFRIQQAKTAAWVAIHLPQPLRAAVEDQWKRNGDRTTLLLPRADGTATPDWAFQRAFRKLAGSIGLPHVQFRDLRRSGMILWGELGVELQFITAQSGHAVLGNKRTILDTYMPGNPRFAAEGMAQAWTRYQARKATDQKESNG